MDVKKALEVVAKLHQEKDLYHKKSIKAKKWSLITLIVGATFLIGFIVIVILTSKDYNYQTGLILMIIFGVFALIFLETAIILYTLNKCVYRRNEENRKKILTYIEKEVNHSKKE